MEWMGIAVPFGERASMRGHTYKIKQKRIKSGTTKHFSYVGVWNVLPVDEVATSSKLAFTRELEMNERECFSRL